MFRDLRSDGLSGFADIIVVRVPIACEFGSEATGVLGVAGGVGSEPHIVNPCLVYLVARRYQL